MNLYSVTVPDSTEDSEFLVVAPDALAAATLYVEGVTGDQLAVDTEEMADAGELDVHLIGDQPGEARVLQWGSDERVTRSLGPIETTEVKLDGIEAWTRYAASEGLAP
ncbi:hypothetical protein LAZ40_09865 [Cereibacter sphaeroides]|uniref:hypothetical protein n=1 Tax=Cereibacter sphaeroides TaxID=1063 RepID=UPI001F2496CF|nr:hypothetical protein [Cereibacter sphaeroides]MCE6959357.1 hypothetical protein [Cereibacter sphaeroides]MCE6972949.1 hypothetical protein [Cereibacter sphaeroides]